MKDKEGLKQCRRITNAMILVIGKISIMHQKELFVSRQ